MTDSIFEQADIVTITSKRVDGSMKHHKVLQKEMVHEFMRKHHLRGDLVTMNQIHGNTVAVLDNLTSNPLVATDGIVTQKDFLLGVFTADCLPVLFYDRRTRTIGAVHAGFRGIYNKVIPEAIERFENLGARPKDILVGIGPGIGVCCYDVDVKRAVEFQQAFGGDVVEYRDRKQFLDLKKAAVRQLVEVGVLPEHVVVQDLCTQCNNEQYFSYRGDSDKTFGEIITVIGFV